MLHGVVVERRHVVDVRHGEGDDVVVVRVVDVDAADLDLASVQEELPGLWKKPKKKSVRKTKMPVNNDPISVSTRRGEISRVHLCRCVCQAAAS